MKDLDNINIMKRISQQLVLLMNKNTNTNINNIGLVDKIYEEISFTCTEINSSYEANYADSTLNFFGVSSGIRYQNLDSNTFERR